MISVQKLSKRYRLQKLFDEVSFTINKGERVGLVGRNGHGKTTLFRIIVGDETPDTGEVVIPKGYTIGRIDQYMQFSQPTVLAEASQGLRPEEKDAVWKVEKILMGLGFSEADFARPVEEFSGGYQMRLVLAKVLVAEPRMLLLDEPTNFLDIVSIRWLERFLSDWRGECILISHDRTFMDNVVTHVMGIHRGSLKKIKGHTVNYYEQLSFEEEVYERRRVNQEKKQKQMKQFITKFRAKARHGNLVQSRIKALEKLGTKDKLSSVERLRFSFPCSEIPAKTIIQADDICFSYSSDEPLLIKALSFTVEKGDKICVVGKNGKGKTTLIKLLAAELRPVNGKVRSHPRCEVACYEQAHTARLDPACTVEDELMKVASTGEGALVRSVCGGMMFSGDHMKKRISVLSGGEKCRVMLGKLLVGRHNLLLLDEPSQHLDIESCDAIIDAVKRFKGAAVIVTHDERFLREVATKLIVFQHNEVRVFPGTYQEFLEQVGWEEEGITAVPNLPKKPKPAKQKTEQQKTKHVPAKKINAKQLRQARAAFNRQKKPLERRVADLERRIKEKEDELAQANEGLVIASQTGAGPEIKTLSQSVYQLQHEINELYVKWEIASEAYSDFMEHASLQE